MLAWKVFGSGLTGLAVNSLCKDADSSLVATGSANTDALELVSAMNTVITTPLNSGVILSSKATPGDWQFVLNLGANTLNVYPPVGQKFAYSATDAPFALLANDASLFVQFTPTVWY